MSAILFSSLNLLIFQAPWFCMARRGPTHSRSHDPKVADIQETDGGGIPVLLQCKCHWTSLKRPPLWVVLNERWSLMKVKYTLVRYIKLRIAHAPGMFSLPSRVNDPDMHHGMCMTHVPWCMSRSLNRGGRENLPSIPGIFATHNFTHPALWHFHKNTRSCVENECCCPRTVNISNVNFTSRISTLPEPVFKNMGQQMSGPDSSIGWSIRHESEGWGFKSLSGRDIILSQKLWHIHKNTHLCVENECCCPCTVNISNVNFTSKISNKRPMVAIWGNFRIFYETSMVSLGHCDTIWWHTSGSTLAQAVSWYLTALLDSMLTNHQRGFVHIIRCRQSKGKCWTNLSLRILILQPHIPGFNELNLNIFLTGTRSEN